MGKYVCQCQICDGIYNSMGTLYSHTVKVHKVRLELQKNGEYKIVENLRKKKTTFGIKKGPSKPKKSKKVQKSPKKSKNTKVRIRPSKKGPMKVKKSPKKKRKTNNDPDYEPENENTANNYQYVYPFEWM